MISTKWKLATVLGVAGAIALSAASAEAQNARKKLVRPDTFTSSRNITQPSHSSHPSHPSFYGRSFNYYGAPAGNDVNFNDGRYGANYDPNQ